MDIVVEMSEFVIYILKHDRWCFKQYAKLLLVKTDNTKVQVEGIIGNIIELIDEGQSVEEATHYVRVTGPIIKTKIDSLYALLFNYKEQLPLDKFDSSLKWSIILSCIWSKVADSLSHQSTNYNEQLHGREIKTFLEKIANYQEEPMMDVDPYDPNEANILRVKGLELQLESKLTEQFNKHQQMGYHLENYRNFAETEIGQLQKSMEMMGHENKNQQEENIWLRQCIMFLMNYPIAMQFIKTHLMTSMTQLGIADEASGQTTTPGESYLDVVRMVMKLIQSALQCKLKRNDLKVKFSSVQMTVEGSSPYGLGSTNSPLSIGSGARPPALPAASSTMEDEASDNREIQAYLQQISQSLQPM